MNGFRIFILSWCLSTAAVADEPWQQWVQERAKSYQETFRKPQAQLTVEPSGELWRQRPANHALPGFQPPTSWAPLIRDVGPAVVNIRVMADGNTPQEPVRRSLGSGFILSADGYAVTNNHVVDRGRQIFVKLSDGREFSAVVAGRDPSTDVALIHLEGASGLPVAYLGDSDLLEVGEWVAAIGNPFGLDHSVSHGMISAKERVLGVGVFDDFIQTDALINPGNSGGPLFNMKGEVVGVNTAIVSQGQGIGFAVPINMVKDLLPNLRSNGRLARGWLGVNIQEQPVGSQKGAIIKEVFRNSPADEAGLRAGDQVLSVNGRPIESYLQLLRRIAILAPRSQVKLTLRRGDAQREATVTLAERPAPETLRVVPTAGESAPLGLLVKDLDSASAKRLGVTPDAGVLIVGIMPGSNAEQAGLQAGELLIEVNRRPVPNSRAYEEALKATSGDAVLLRVRRGTATRWIAVPR